MPIIVRVHFFSWLLLVALVVSGCSVEIDQTTGLTPTPSIENTPPAAATSRFPTTQVPVTWADLDLAGKLVYVSSEGEGDTLSTEIQMLDLRTGELATLFYIPGAWIYYATVSPDAKWVAMSYSPPASPGSSSNRSLYILPLDGSAPPLPLFTPPTPDDHYTQAEWSPDGKYIYYVHYNHNDAGGAFYEAYELFRMTYPGAEAAKIVDHAFWPRLSPDSSRLVYIALDPASGKHDLFVANADGSNPQRIPLPDPLASDVIDAPIFSPDGQSILLSAPGPSQSYQPNWFERLVGIQVASAHNVPSDWWSVPIAGGMVTRLTSIQTVNLFASISPDQKHIASLGGEGIFVMDPDGSNLTQLISDPGIHGTISWIP